VALEQITVIAAIASKVKQSIAPQGEWIAFAGGPAR
jgi:hypothetical protein